MLEQADAFEHSLKPAKLQCRSRALLPLRKGHESRRPHYQSPYSPTQEGTLQPLAKADRRSVGWSLAKFEARFLPPKANIASGHASAAASQVCGSTGLSPAVPSTADRRAGGRGQAYGDSPLAADLPRVSG